MWYGSQRREAVEAPTSKSTYTPPLLRQQLVPIASAHRHRVCTSRHHVVGNRRSCPRARWASFSAPSCWVRMAISYRTPSDGLGEPPTLPRSVEIHPAQPRPRRSSCKSYNFGLDDARIADIAAARFMMVSRIWVCRNVASAGISTGRIYTTEERPESLVRESATPVDHGEVDATLAQYGIPSRHRLVRIPPFTLSLCEPNMERDSMMARAHPLGDIEHSTASPDRSRLARQRPSIAGAIIHYAADHLAAGRGGWRSSRLREQSTENSLMPREAARCPTHASCLIVVPYEPLSGLAPAATPSRFRPPRRSRS